jgi:hypothetical protein
MATCSACASELRPAAKFCGKCGVPVAVMGRTAGQSPVAAQIAAPAFPPAPSMVPVAAPETPMAPASAAAVPARRRAAPHLPAVTAKGRSKLRLQVTTSLAPAAALDAVRAATGAGKGGGVSLLTTGIVNLSAGVHVETESPTRLGLSITSGKRLVELCTFSAEVTQSGEATSLRVGGLETYKTLQTKTYGVPVGPKRIMGYDPYRRFLEEAAAKVLDGDPGAAVEFVVPD